jgi:hypothetical protein
MRDIGLRIDCANGGRTNGRKRVNSVVDETIARDRNSVKLKQNISVPR